MDTAMPYLDQKGITYYNPQVEKWDRSLVKVEAVAKAGAHALLFVIGCVRCRLYAAPTHRRSLCWAHSLC
jgi:hypothetical protein